MWRVLTSSYCPPSSPHQQAHRRCGRLMPFAPAHSTLTGVDTTQRHLPHTTAASRRTRLAATLAARSRRRQSSDRPEATSCLFVCFVVSSPLVFAISVFHRGE